MLILPPNGNLRAAYRRLLKRRLPRSVRETR
jgi:hypothetical protein